MQLVDMLCKIQACLEGFLPFAWVSFAVDVAELWVPGQKFVEGTQEAGRAHLWQLDTQSSEVFIIQ